MFLKLFSLARTKAGLARSDVAVLTALAATMAFIFVAGVMQHDMLKAYVATLRIVDGQLPYRDFFPQNPPLSNALAAPVFAVLPTIGAAVLVLAVTINVTATLLMHGLILRLTGSRGPAVVAGLLTAFWYCQHGGYYFDQVTYLLGFAAFARYTSRPEGANAGAAEGLLLACGVLAKQSVGSFVAAAFVVTVVLFHGFKPLLRPGFLVALLAPPLVFCVYLTAIDGWQGFYTYAIAQQADYADTQIDLWRLATDFLRPWNLDIVDILRNGRLGQLSFFPLALGVYLSYLVVALGLRRGRIGRRFAAGYVFLLLSTVWAAATPLRLYTHVTFGFPGIAALTVYALAALSSESARAAVGRWAALVAVGVFGGIALLQASYNLYPDARQASPLARGNLWPLTFDRQQVEAITAAATIESERKTYALFGENYLNAVPLALGRAPVDPMLFYEHILMIPSDEGRRRAWEAMVIAHLEARQADFLLTGFVSADERFPTLIRSMDGLPALQAYFEQTYSHVAGRSGGVTLFARTRSTSADTKGGR